MFGFFKFRQKDFEGFKKLYIDSITSFLYFKLKKKDLKFLLSRIEALCWKKRGPQNEIFAIDIFFINWKNKNKLSPLHALFPKACVKFSNLMSHLKLQTLQHYVDKLWPKIKYARWSLGFWDGYQNFSVMCLKLTCSPYLPRAY